MKKSYGPAMINDHATFQTPKRNAQQAAEFARWGFHKPATTTKTLPWYHMPLWTLARKLRLV